MQSWSWHTPDTIARQGSRPFGSAPHHWGPPQLHQGINLSHPSPPDPLCVRHNPRRKLKRRWGCPPNGASIDDARARPSGCARTGTANLCSPAKPAPRRWGAAEFVRRKATRRVASLHCAECAGSPRQLLRPSLLSPAFRLRHRRAAQFVHKSSRPIPPYALRPPGRAEGAKGA